MLRAAFGTGYRAPTLSDLHQPQSLFPTDFPDPVRCPDMFDPQPGDDCSGVPVKAGGNSALQPETSRQVNAGIVIEPVRGLSASVDYYRVKLSNVIDVVPPDVILGPGHAQWEAGYIVREPPDPQQPDLPGKIVYAVQYPTNLGTITTSGIDLGLQWQGPATSIGRFSLGLNGTYVLEYTQSGFVSDFVPSGVGMRGILGAIARYRQYAHLDWALGPWGATLANNYQSGYSEPCSPYDPSGCALRGVGSYSVWDVQVRYSAGANTMLSLGIRNMLDAVPPLTAQYGAWQVRFGRESGRGSRCAIANCLRRRSGGCHAVARSGECLGDPPGGVPFRRVGLGGCAAGCRRQRSRRQCRPRGTAAQRRSANSDLHTVSRAV